VDLLDVHHGEDMVVVGVTSGLAGSNMMTEVQTPSTMTDMQ